MKSRWSKFIGIILGLVGIGVISIVTYLVVADFLTTEKTTEKSENREPIQETEQVKEVSEDKVKEYEEKELNPFGDSVKITELKDNNVRDYIHGMSHQKVVAEKKWGFYGINTTRIEWLLKGVEEASDLKNQDLYITILTKWKEDDFSTVDQDHNAIWELQGGTVGKATGIMTNEEEREYVESQNERR